MRVCSTWRRSLDDDVDCHFWDLSIEDLEGLLVALSFFFLRHRVEHNGNVVVTVILNSRHAR